MSQYLSVRVAATVRAELARRNLSGRHLARECGWTTSYTGRRLTGVMPFTVDELDLVARVLKMRVADLLAAPAPTKAVAS